VANWYDSTTTGLTGAQLESNLRRGANVKDFGAAGDGTTDDRAAIQSAIDAVATDGGMVFFPAGTYLVSTPGLVLPEAGFVCLQGEGMESTTIKRSTSGQNFVLLEASGADADNPAFSNDIRDMTLHGNDGGIAPVLRSYYFARMTMDRVRVFANTTGAGWEIVQGWDSYFTRCRIDNCGSSDATYSCVEIAARTTDTVDAFGYGIDNCNNLYFVNCVHEANRSPIRVRINGRGAGVTGTPATGAPIANGPGIWFIGHHAESSAMVDSLFTFLDTDHSGILSSNIYGSGVTSGGPYDLVTIGGAASGRCSHFTIADSRFGGEEAIPRTGIAAKRSNHLQLRNLVYLASTDTPTEAFIEFSGSNTSAQVDRVTWYQDTGTGGSEVIVSGSPTSYMATVASLPVVAGVVDDTNWATTTGMPAFDGALAYDSTNDKFSFRSGGTWRQSAALA
jgi:hypothetical protein